jgi:hypothetical protein
MMADPKRDAARAAAEQLAAQAQGVARSWLRRNVWGVVGVALAALLLAAALLRWG